MSRLDYCIKFDGIVKLELSSKDKNTAIAKCSNKKGKFEISLNKNNQDVFENFRSKQVNGELYYFPNKNKFGIFEFKKI